VGTTEDGPAFGLVANRTEMHARIDRIIERVKAGGDR